MAEGQEAKTAEVPAAVPLVGEVIPDKHAVKLRKNTEEVASNPKTMKLRALDAGMTGEINWGYETYNIRDGALTVPYEVGQQMVSQQPFLWADAKEDEGAVKKRLRELEGIRDAQIENQRASMGIAHEVNPKGSVG